MSKEKNIKLSKNTIMHLENCLKYVFAKNQGNEKDMKANLEAIVPHQFGDHSPVIQDSVGTKENLVKSLSTAVCHISAHSKMRY